MKLILVFGAIGAVLVAAGCNSLSQSEVVGDWKGATVNEPKTSEIEHNLTNMFAGGIKLAVKPDGTFHAIFFIAPIDGKWHIQGSELILKPESNSSVKIDNDNIHVDADGEIHLVRAADGGLVPKNAKSSDTFRLEKDSH